MCKFLKTITLFVFLLVASNNQAATFTDSSTFSPGVRTVMTDQNNGISYWTEKDNLGQGKSVKLKFTNDSGSSWSPTKTVLSTTSTIIKDIQWVEQFIELDNALIIGSTVVAEGDDGLTRVIWRKSDNLGSTWTPEKAIIKKGNSFDKLCFGTNWIPSKLVTVTRADNTLLVAVPFIGSATTTIVSYAISNDFGDTWKNAGSITIPKCK